jgi:hypothetical protein
VWETQPTEELQSLPGGGAPPQRMIKYHGTPIGGTKKEAALFLQGRHALISFAHPDQIAEVLECCESFCLDNGAFSIWKTTGGRIDILRYKAWVNGLRRHPSFDFAIIPDVIGGTEKENDELITEWGDIKGSVPVFHLDESPDRFLRLAEKFEKVALGSTDKWPANGSYSWWVYMADLMDRITDSQGSFPCKVHGLRMLDPRIFRYLPLHSGDSTNVAVNNGGPMKNKSYPAVSRSVASELIAQKIEQFQSADAWSREVLISNNMVAEWNWSLTQ